MTPDGWQKCLLQDVVEGLGSGQSPNCHPYPAQPGEWAILKTTAITWERGWSPEENKAILPGFEPKPEHVVRTGDVLITKAGPVHRVGVVVEVTDTPDGLMVSGKMTRIRTDSRRCLSAFLARALASEIAQDHLLRRTTGMAASQTNFTHKALLLTPFLLPPLPEQRKIAAILSSVEEVIEKTEAVVEHLQVVKRAMMQELLTRGLPGRHTRFKQTEIGEVPEGWQVIEFGSQFELTNGANFKATQRGETGVPTVDVKNMYGDGVELETQSLYRIDFGDQPVKTIEPDDIVFVRSSVKREGVGQACLVGPLAETTSFCGFIIRARATSSSWVPQFLIQTLRSPQVRTALVDGASHSAITNINQKLIAGLQVPVPSKDEQFSIARLLRSVDDRVVEERKTAKTMRRTKAALMSALLTGEVRVTPDEEAA